MEHELTLGNYCRLESKPQWTAVVALADALGILYPGSYGLSFENHPRIWWAGHYVTLTNNKFPGFVEGPQVPVPEFIDGMYRLAEKRKASPPPEPQAGGIRGEEREMYVFTEGKWVSISRRITKLEERAMTNEGLNHLRAQVDALRGTVSNLETALNEHLVAYREHYHVMGGAPITAAGAGDQVTNDEQVRYVSRLRMCYEDSEVSIRKEASPKNIPFEVALVYLKAGRRVRLCGWQKAWLQKHEVFGISFHPGYDEREALQMDFNAGHLNGGINAMLGSEWEVVPEQ